MLNPLHNLPQHDQDDVAILLTALASSPEFVTVEIGLLRAFSVAGLLQTVMRHPHLPAAFAEIALDTICEIRDLLVQVTGSPEIGILIDKGFDEANDRDFNNGQPVHTPSDQPAGFEHIAEQDLNDIAQILGTIAYTSPRKPGCQCAGCRHARREVPTLSTQNDQAISTVVAAAIRANFNPDAISAIIMTAYVTGVDNARQEMK